MVEVESALQSLQTEISESAMEEYKNRLAAEKDANERYV